MMLGTIAARNTPTEDWFVERIRDVVRVVGVRSWEQLKGMMEMVMWMESVCDVGGLAVWNEVGAGDWSETGSPWGEGGAGTGRGIADC